MENNKPLVSIIIPCRNEEKFIAECIESLLKQDYPRDKLEILVIDGTSTDKTRDIVFGYSKKYPFVRLVSNPRRITPCAFNIGIKESKGEVTIIMGAHARYEKDYVLRCAGTLLANGADDVGGVAVILPSNDSLVAKAIALSLSNKFGSGNAAYKMAPREGVRKVDTVFGGCYRKDVFARIGLFNEALIRTQDIELNIRLKKAGGKILLDPKIIFYYYARPDLKSFLLMNFNSGMWVIYSRKFTKIWYKLRHYIPFVFLLAVVGSLILAIMVPFVRPLLLMAAGLYLLAVISWSLLAAVKFKNVAYLAITPAVFFVRHFAYGFGSLVGAFKLLIPIKK